MLMMAKISVLVAFAALAACMVSTRAWADDITISPLGTVTVTQGELNVAVDGTLINNTGGALDVLGSETVPGADPSSILDFSPFTLSAGTNGPMELFSFNVLPDAALGTELGSYTILDALGNTYTADFTVDVLPAAAVPEPGTVILLGSGLAALGFFRRRAKDTA